MTAAWGWLSMTLSQVMLQWRQYFPILSMPSVTMTAVWAKTRLISFFAVTNMSFLPMIPLSMVTDPVLEIILADSASPLMTMLPSVSMVKPGSTFPSTSTSPEYFILPTEKSTSVLIVSCSPTLMMSPCL